MGVPQTVGAGVIFQNESDFSVTILHQNQLSYYCVLVGFRSFTKPGGLARVSQQPFHTPGTALALLLITLAEVSMTSIQQPDHNPSYGHLLVFHQEQILASAEGDASSNTS